MDDPCVGIVGGCKAFESSCQIKSGWLAPGSSSRHGHWLCIVSIVATIVDATVALANHRGHGGALGALIQTRGQFVDGYFYVIGSKRLCDDSLDGGTLVVCWTTWRKLHTLLHASTCCCYKNVATWVYILVDCLPCHRHYCKDVVMVVAVVAVPLSVT